MLLPESVSVSSAVSWLSAAGLCSGLRIPRVFFYGEQRSNAGRPALQNP